MERLSAAEARRIALAAQGFTDKRPTGATTARHIRRALGRVGLLQIDSVNVLVRSHELPLFSRLGPYPRATLTDLIEQRRELFEYWGHAASFIPVGLFPALRWRMTAAAARGHWRQWALEEQRPSYVADVLEQVRERGPLTVGDLSDPGRSKGPWWGWGEGKVSLEWLFRIGDVTAAGRTAGFERIYDLTERVLPAAVLDAPALAVDDAHRTLLAHAARWHGVGTARDLGDYFRLPVRSSQQRLHELVEEGVVASAAVEGWRERAFVHVDAARPRAVRAAALLSPFDSLVWERPRTERLFGMRLRLELYTPAPKRTFGYYVLPLLLGDQLVARVDLKAERKRSELHAIATHIEPAHTDLEAEATDALADQLAAMAAWLELERVVVKRR